MSEINQCNFFDIFGLTAEDKYKSRLNLIDKDCFYSKGTIFEPDTKLFDGWLCFYENKPLIIELIENRGIDSVYSFKIGIFSGGTFVNTKMEKNLFRFTPERWAKVAYLNGSFRIKYSIEYLKKVHNDARKDNEHILKEELKNCVITDLKTGKETKADNAVKKSFDLNVNSFVLCLAYEYDERLFEKFDSDACLVITDVEEFENRLSKSILNYNLVGSRVFYNNQLHRRGPLFNKNGYFKNQKEFRFLWQNPTNPICCSEEDIELENIEWISKKMPEYIDINMGSLKDISFVIDRSGKRINFES